MGIFNGSCSIVYRNFFLGYSTSRQLHHIAKQKEESTCFKPHIVSLRLKSVLRLRISRHTMAILVVWRSLWPGPWSSSGRFTTATILQHSHIGRFYFWHGVAKWMVTIWLVVSYTAISMFSWGVQPHGTQTSSLRVLGCVFVLPACLRMWPQSQISVKTSFIKGFGRRTPLLIYCGLRGYMRMRECCNTIAESIAVEMKNMWTRFAQLLLLVCLQLLMACFLSVESPKPSLTNQTWVHILFGVSDAVGLFSGHGPWRSEAGPFIIGWWSQCTRYRCPPIWSGFAFWFCWWWCVNEWFTSKWYTWRVCILHNCLWDLVFSIAWMEINSSKQSFLGAYFLVQLQTLSMQKHVCNMWSRNVRL